MKYRKYNPEVWDEARELHDAGLTYSEIAEELDVNSYQLVRYHLDDEYRRKAIERSIRTYSDTNIFSRAIEWLKEI